MFEGKTTIKFSREAAMALMSHNLSDMFKMSLEVTAMDMEYDGLEVKFQPTKEKSPKPQAASSTVPPEPKQESEETLEEKAKQ